jgi:hypothetical protein
VQKGDLETTAEHNVRITANKGVFEATAKEELLLTCGGGYMRLAGGNIEVHAPTMVDLKASNYGYTGPGGESVAGDSPEPKTCGSADDAAAAGGGVIALGAALLGAIQSAAEKVGDAIKGAAEKVGDAVQGAAEKAGDAVQGAAEKAADAVRGVGEKILSAMDKVVETLHPPGPLDDPQVQALVSKSPTLKNDLDQLKSEGWKVVYGPSGEGSTCDKRFRTITLDQDMKGNTENVVQALAHETGHAKYNVPVDRSSKAAYVKSFLADEGAATLKNIDVQKEILANGGPDIGLPGNSANHPAYASAHAQYEAAGRTEAAAAQARDKIGGIFAKNEVTSNTGEPYEDYYGKGYTGFMGFMGSLGF